MAKVEGAIQTQLAACREFDVPCGITAGPKDIEKAQRDLMIKRMGGRLSWTPKQYPNLGGAPSGAGANLGRHAARNQLLRARGQGREQCARDGSHNDDAPAHDPSSAK